MIDSLTVGGMVLEKDVPDMIDANEQLIYDLKTMTSSRLKDRKDMIDAIAVGNLCQPLIFGGIDFGKASDCAGRATYWLVPFKYKTAGFKFCNIRSDFGGLVWRFQDYYGINLKDLPIKYNFAMADLYFGKFADEELKRLRTIIRIMLNSRYGMYGTAIDESIYEKHTKYIMHIPRGANTINFDRWFDWFYNNVIKLRRKK